MPKQTPCLWFDGQAEQAALHYTSIFPNSEILGVTRYTSDTPGPEGDVMTVEFSLDGQRYVGLNGGPQFSFTEAISFQIHCETQDEIDYYWSKLTADGGQESQCGWLKDKFGLSWQVTPRQLIDLTTSDDPAQNARVFAAMMQMKKIDIAALEAAAKGPPL